MRVLDGSPIELSDAQLTEFKARLRGELITPRSSHYDDARSLWNAMIDRRPALIARCAGTADVVEAVRFAKEHALLNSVKAGGHNIAGQAICEDGLVIDLSGMNGVWVDPAGRRGRAQAGCTLGCIDRETQLHGLAAVLGFVSTTGAAGVTVGGGFGYLTRKYGWTCDSLRAVEVVTADGEVRAASKSENADLFWAICGGGGNFGVVTSFEYDLYPLGPEVSAGAIAWRGEDAPKVVEFFRSFAAAAPAELTCVLSLRRAPPAPWLPKEIHGKPIALVIVCHTGSAEESARDLAPLKALGDPVGDIVVRRPYTQQQALLDATQPKGRRYYWKSDYLPGIDPESFPVLLEHFERIASPHSAIFLFQLEGALNALPEDHCAAGARDTKWVMNITGSWESPDDDEKNIAWARACWQAMRRFSTGSAYVNFMTEDEGADRILEGYGKNYTRLRELKAKWDPINLFRHNKNILPL
ncbi:MAG: FAD-binding oxidoreductase [Rhodoplanes sp.]